ncbi:Nrap protein [Clohesyomyces aquaticus]|uniref:U3 small nucleolar RNA-associated protein 22 n=1 Tax=Clohesyomyces aquaticus TaxID=1231657 RepID=A0A1Y2A061_9PLEO|nr:Nrap protein [Clohesyomyces aquaticus]
MCHDLPSSDDEEDSGGDIEHDGEANPRPVPPPTKGAQKNGGKAGAEHHHKRRDMSLQDGGYTAGVYKSNLFKLQVDELLQQLKLKHGGKEAAAEKAMHKLKSIMEQIPNREPLLIAEAKSSLEAENVVVPFPCPLPPKDAKYKLQYTRPSSINATGSYTLKTVTRTDEEVAIDLVVTMPRSLFQEKDYLNHRYFYKRAFYLACLAAGIHSSKDHKFKVSFDLLNGNQLQPILVVRPSGDGGVDDFSSSKCRIQILPALPEGTFPESKLRPNVNCVRSNSSDDEPESVKPKPTPFYNATIQFDMSITAYLKLLHYSAIRCNSFKDACILGRVWLRQRGFGSSVTKGGFGNFEWAAITAILLQANPEDGVPPLSLGYSSYQLFKATLQFIATRDLSKFPYASQSRDVPLPKDASPTFFDGPRNMNILFKWSPWSYSRLMSEAQKTVDMLGDSTFDQFESTFILKADTLDYRYDATMEIPLSSLGFDTLGETHDHDMFKACRKIHTLLVRALTDRITTITFQMPSETGWPVSSSKSHQRRGRRIMICLATNPQNANRAIDHGPAAESKKEAASFRQFWGEKAELRRFKDGSILESVVWSSKNNISPVIQQIILFILKKHFSSQVAQEAVFRGDIFAHMIPSGRIVGQSGISPFGPLMTTFATLDKEIRALEGLPLTIRHIIGVDPQLRYSTIEPPSSSPKAHTPKPASVIIQFEGSARWPDDLPTIQRTKIAFLLKLAELVSSSKSTYTTRVGLENPSQPSQNQAYLEIVVPTGFAFRLRIHHDREATLLDRQLRDKSLDNASRESAAMALAVYKREFLQVPAHSQVLQSLCTRFPALSPSLRLTKRWFGSHLLSSHFSPVLIELMVMHTFLQPHPWAVPSCATTGFLRTLAWISRWDWRHVPLVVDFSSFTSGHDPANPSADAKGLKSEDIEKIYLSFEAWRRIDPAMNRVVLFAATNLDREGTTWTDRGMPEKVVATRLTALARSATKFIRDFDERLLVRLSEEEKGDSGISNFAAEALFVPQLTDYDIVVHISSAFSKTGKIKKDSKYKNLQIHLEAEENGDPRRVGGDPLELFVEDLRQIYGDSILWFWNSETLDTIAGLWNPNSTGQRAFKVKAGWNSVPFNARQEDEKRDLDNTGFRGVGIQVNKRVILNEIGRLGGEMVERIEVR